MTCTVRYYIVDGKYLLELELGEKGLYVKAYIVDKYGLSELLVRRFVKGGVLCYYYGVNV